MAASPTTNTKRKNSLPGLIPISSASDCDACPYCLDVCYNIHCTKCAKKRNFWNEKRPQGGDRAHATMELMHASPGFCLFNRKQKIDHMEMIITPCQLKRHNHMDSAWLLCGDEIYDATNYIRGHPGGVKSILKKSGGASDCTKDMKFHSARAIKMWKQNRVGILRPCPGENGLYNDHVSSESTES